MKSRSESSVTRWGGLAPPGSTCCRSNRIVRRGARAAVLSLPNQTGLGILSGARSRLEGPRLGWAGCLRGVMREAAGARLGPRRGSAEGT